MYYVGLLCFVSIFNLIGSCVKGYYQLMIFCSLELIGGIFFCFFVWVGVFSVLGFFGVIQQKVLEYLEVFGGWYSIGGWF